MTDNKIKLGKHRKQQREALDRNSFGLVKRVFKLSWQGRQSLFLVGAFWSLVIAGVTAGLALVTRYLVNDIFVDKNQTAIVGIVIAIVILSIAKGGATYFHSTTNARLNRSLLGGFQRSLFSKFIRLDLSKLIERRAPEHTADLQYFARGSADLVMLLSNNLLRDVATFVALGCVMIAQDFTMTLIVLLAVGPFIFFLRKITRRVKNLSIKQVEFNAKLYSRINEALEGIQTVKSFQLEDKTERRFFSALEKHEEQALKINRVSALLSPLSEFLGAMVVAGLVLFSSIQTIQGDKTPGEYMAFLTAFLFAYEPAKRLARLNVDAQKKLFATKKMFELLDTKIESTAKVVNGKHVAIEDAGIEFRNVTFAYKNTDKAAIRNISFTINPGEKVAIVGRSGSGKSTIANILCCFIRPQKGDVFIGGKDTNQLSDEAVRDVVSLVSQDVFLFEGSIKSNIRDGRPTASDEEIEIAAQKAEVSSFTDKLPDGLKTSVGANADGLSGGQKQRVSIARSILKNAPIVIFDEATSSLDGESESSIISEVITGALEHQTVICIAHRKSTIDAAERVILVDDGEVVADDKIDVLERKNELFKALFHIDSEDE